MGTFEDGNEIALNGAGHYRDWKALTSFTGAPSLDTHGIGLFGLPNGSLWTLVDVNLRVSPNKRTATLTNPTFDASATYTITVDGHSDSDTGDTDVNTTFSTLKTTLEGNSSINPLVTITVDGDTMTITGKSDEDFSIGFSATGSAVVAVEADPVSAVVKGWANYAGATKAGTPPTGWRHRPCWTWTPDWRGLNEDIRTAGLGRVYIEVETYGHAADGPEVTLKTPTVRVGKSTVPQ